MSNDVRGAFSSARLILISMAALALVLFSAWPATFDLGRNWIFNEAYRHGFVLIIPADFLAWQNATRPMKANQPSWLFLPAGIASLIVILIAHLSELHEVVHYGYFGLLIALVLGVSGLAGFKR